MAYTTNYYTTLRTTTNTLYYPTHLYIQIHITLFTTLCTYDHVLSRQQIELEVLLTRFASWLTIFLSMSADGLKKINEKC